MIKTLEQTLQEEHGKAISGDVVAMRFLGKLYMTGESHGVRTVRNREHGRRWLENAAERNDSVARMLLQTLDK